MPAQIKIHGAELHVNADCCEAVGNIEQELGAIIAQPLQMTRFKNTYYGRLPGVDTLPSTKAQYGHRGKGKFYSCAISHSTVAQFLREPNPQGSRLERLMKHAPGNDFVVGGGELRINA